MSQTSFGSLKEAFSHHTKLGSGIVTRIERWTDTGRRNTFAIFENESSLVEYVEKHADSRTVHEVVYCKEHADTVSNPNPARYYVDMDYKVPLSEASRVNWEEWVTLVICAVREIFLEKSNGSFDGGECARMECCRTKADGEHYKFSEHLLFRQVCLEDPMICGAELTRAVLANLKKRHGADAGVAETLDTGVYDKNHQLRVAGCGKSAKEPDPVRARSGVSGSLLVRGTLNPDIPFVTLAPKPGTTASRKRKATSSVSSCGSPVPQNDPMIKFIEDFIRTKTKQYGWHECEITDKQHNLLRGTYHVTLTFPQKGTKHTCPAGTKHNGNCNQRRFLSFDENEKVIKSYCFDNGKGAPCAKKWTPLLHPETKEYLWLY